eukprot:gene14192-10139_t
MQAAEQNNAAGQAAVVPPSANSTAKVPNTSGSKRGQEHQSKNSHKGHPQSISAKRSLSATFDEVVREDHPQKRQRAQSAEEEGIISEKSAIEPAPAGYPSTSPRDYPMSRYGPSSSGPSATHFDGYGQRADASAGAYPNYPSNTAQSSVPGYGGKQPRYYGSYDERERAEYGFPYPSNQGPVGREASASYGNHNTVERMNYLPPAHATGDYNRQPTTTAPSASSASGVNAAGYEYEEGEYRERSRPQSRASHGNSIYAPTHQDFYGGAQVPTVYPETSIYGSRSSSAVNTPNHGSRDFYEQENRRYPGQAAMHQGAPNSREHRERENSRHQRPNDALSRYAPSQ